MDPRNKTKKGDEGEPAPVRENLESLAVAVALALMLKFFLLEAYKIPTSSMQPTLMGDARRGVFDRILVDKLAFLLREPRRWEVAVFKYPLNQAQNYIKRIWGLPGEWILVRGGDVWKGEDGDFLPETRPRKILRKPTRLQDHLWLYVYHSEDLPGSLSRVLREDPGRLTLSPAGKDAVEMASRGSGGMALYFRDVQDRDEHGYPGDAIGAVADQIQGEGGFLAAGFNYVGDLKVSADVEILEGCRALVLEVQERTSMETLAYTARIPAGKGPAKAALQVNGRVVREASLERPLAAGTKRRVSLSNCDDRLVLEVDGKVLLTYPYPSKGDPLVGSRVGLGLEGPGRARISRFHLDRDIYYTDPSALASRPQGAWFHLGPRGFLMLGDNSRHSADSREWMALYLKDPATGRLIRGNFRPGGFSEDAGQDPLNPDWNPVFVAPAKSLVFTDDQGEEYVLKPPIPGRGREWLNRAERWVEQGGGGKIERVFQVPREFIVGKAFAVFWPIDPFRGVFRLHFVN